MRLLIVNAGSSSLKLRRLDPEDRTTHEVDLAAAHGCAPLPALATALEALGEVDAVGHRVVHGGTAYTGAVRIDAAVEKRLHGLADLAPLHQPAALATLRAVSERLPGVPAVACFDTAFHATLPAAASTYALPAEWRERWGLRRHGFHGLSHAHASRRAAEILGARPRRLVTCHLGAGASLAAILDGRSVDTTMGFTPLEGLVMATRSGSVDPGLVLWLEEHAHTPAAEMAATLEHRSGLLGLTGTSDMKEIVIRAVGGDATARLGLDVYLHRLRAGIASMAAAMDGLDALVFTGGVGERSAAVRAGAADGLGFLGVSVDPEHNAPSRGDRDIGRPGAPVRTLVVESREDLEIARQVRSLLGPVAGR